MALIDVAEARTLLSTSLTDTELEVVFDREEAEMVRLYGPHAPTPVTVILSGERATLYLSRPIASVTSITEAVALGEAATTLLASEYYVWSTQGRITRLPEGTRWARVATVVYVPANDNDLRAAVLIDLVRLAITRRAAASWMEERHADTVGKTDSVTAPKNWDQERQSILHRLAFPGVS